MTTEMQSVLINGYIHEIEASLSKKQIIPSEINELCLLYFNEIICFIKVFCKIRPLSSTDIYKGNKSVIDLDENNDNRVQIINTYNEKQLQFKFDKTYGPNTTQYEISVDLEDYIDNVLKGSILTIFTWGAAGGGKTYTIIGSKTDPGITHRSIKYIFDKIEKQKHNDSEYSIECAIFEIYNEKIKDLITNNNYCKIKEEENGEVKVENVTWNQLNSAAEYSKLNDISDRNRHCRATAFNGVFKTRSHVFTVFKINVKNIENQMEYVGYMYLIDLTGSHRVKKCGISSEIAKETQNIGKSLGSLSNVLSTIQMNEKFIPYKNSILTMLLEKNLSNGNDVVLYLNIYPIESQLFETICTLRFGQRISFNHCNERRKKKVKKPTF